MAIIKGVSTSFLYLFYIVLIRETIGYGYDSSATVNGIVDGYQKSQTPLDGMHLDVDFQVIM